MEALSNKEIKELCKSYQHIGTLRGVSRKFGRSQNTIKKYVSRFMEVKRQNLVKGLASSDSRLIGTYVGLWMGDGTQYYDRGFTIKICSDKRRKNLNNFIQDLIIRLFRKKSYIVEEKTTNRAYIKFASKYIFDFIYEYVILNVGKKTYSIKLKKNVNHHKIDFLEGCLLGLSLTDGYLKKFIRFNVISSRLAKNMYDILARFGFNPHHYIHDRREYGWKNLHMISLKKEESERLTRFLDEIIKKLGYDHSFNKLKYGPVEI